VEQRVGRVRAYLGQFRDCRGGTEERLGVERRRVRDFS
jgi:hypothetical protein